MLTISSGESPALIHWKSPHRAFSDLLAALLQEISPVYVVGGTVRDFILGRSQEFNDFDLIVDGPAITLARRIADRLGWAFYPMDAARDVARLVLTGNRASPLVCDIARMRGGLIEHDLMVRDFTINAMAFEIRGPNAIRLIDRHGGQEDLASGTLRRVNAVSLADDPVRLLRAVRFMLQLDLRLDADTQTQLERLVSTVRHASAERARDELWKMLATDRPEDAIRLLHSFGLLSHVLPELAATIGVAQSAPHHLDVYEHTLAVVRHTAALRDWVLGRPLGAPLPGGDALLETLAPRRFALRHHFAVELAVGHNRADWLVWDALFHDVGKPPTTSLEPIASAVQGSPESTRIRFFGHEQAGAQMAEARLTHLRFSRHEIALAEAVIAQHMRLHHLHHSFEGAEISRRARFRFYRDVGGRQFNYRAGLDVAMLGLADYLGTRQSLEQDWRAYIQHAAQLLDYAFSAADPLGGQVAPLVDGRQLMRHLGLKPGKELGAILDQLLEAQAAGEIATVEDALHLASRWAAAEGLAR